MEYTINIRGKLLSLARPQVMAIVNVTPNSFYAPSRVQSASLLRERIRTIIADGGDMIDVGACSTNPYLEQFTDEAEEMRQLDMALTVIREMDVDLPISVDTFRPEVARRCIQEYGVDIINDISSGEDETMFDLVAETGTPYILMSQQPTLRDILMEMAQKVQLLRDRGQKDIILDPGFGFGKTMEQNLHLLYQSDRFGVLGLPVLVGVSRKRMVYQTLGVSTEESLNGTTVLHTVALMRGASILRVHDVKEATQAVRLYQSMTD